MSWFKTNFEVYIKIDEIESIADNEAETEKLLIMKTGDVNLLSFSKFKELKKILKLK